MVLVLPARAPSNELYPFNNFVLELLKRIGGALDERLHAIGEEIKRIGVAEKMAKSEESAEFGEVTIGIAGTGAFAATWTVFARSPQTRLQYEVDNQAYKVQPPIQRPVL